MKMKFFNVQELQKSCIEDPCFFVNIYNVGRGFTKETTKKGPCIVSSNTVLIWKIIEDVLTPVNYIGGLYNNESYLIQWSFDYILNDNELKKETIFFYWRGTNAQKGLSPLPANFENDYTIVQRIVQWSEPAAFFHLFPKPLLVLDENFDPNKKHLFMVRGELQNEFHLYELPYFKKNLRSRGVFIIVDPHQEIIYLWKGSKITKEFESTIKEIDFIDSLKHYVDWMNFKVFEMNENDEINLFESNSGEYFHVVEECNFSPRLFYLNSITGEFLATEIEYPLRNKKGIAPFPFLQSHLCTADQLGLFLLDNNHEVWLINESKTETYGELYNLAKKSTTEYAKLKEQNLKRFVPVRFIKSDTDFIEFTNIFPYWN